MSDFEDVSGFESPVDPMETLIKMMKKLVKSEGPVGVMNLYLTEDTDAMRELVEDGSLSQEEADVLAFIGRTGAIQLHMSDGLCETPTDCPYYVAFEDDNNVNIIFMKDKRLAKLIDWRT